MTDGLDDGTSKQRKCQLSNLERGCCAYCGRGPLETLTRCAYCAEVHRTKQRARMKRTTAPEGH